MISYQEFCEASGWVASQALIAKWVDRLQWPELEMIDDEFVTRTRFNSEYTIFNNIFLSRIGPENFQRQLERCIDRLREEETPSRWIIGPHTQPTDLAERLTRMGYSERETLWLMANDLSVLQRPTIPENFSMKRVTSESELKIWSEVQARSFGFPKKLESYWHDMQSSCGYESPSPWKHYVCRLDGEVCASLSALWSDQVMVLDSLGVLPEFREHCVATVAGQYALTEAADAGYQVAIGFATDEIAEISTRIGFRRFSKIEQISVGGTGGKNLTVEKNKSDLNTETNKAIYTLQS